MVIGHIQKIYRVNNKEFDTREEAKKYIAEDLERDTLIKDLHKKKRLIVRSLDSWILPVFKEGRSSDYLKDSEINCIRAELYEFMCLRRKLLGVVEFDGTEK